MRPEGTIWSKNNARYGGLFDYLYFFNKIPLVLGEGIVKIRWNRHCFFFFCVIIYGWCLVTKVCNSSMFELRLLMFQLRIIGEMLAVELFVLWNFNYSNK